MLIQSVPLSTISRKRPAVSRRLSALVGLGGSRLTVRLKSIVARCLSDGVGRTSRITALDWLWAYAYNVRIRDHA